MAYTSPDRRIRKTVLAAGKGCFKPTENCLCSFAISKSNVDLDKYRKYSYSIGDSEDAFERCLDVLLQNMLESEEAEVIFEIDGSNVEFTIELASFARAGFIYEWDPPFKYKLAVHHKAAGNELYKAGRFKDASFRFRKGLKILLSIPLNVENVALEDPPLADLYGLKANLYNNLASCQLLAKNYEMVDGLCSKVLEHDGANVKARYKKGVALFELHSYEEALEMLRKARELEGDNKAVADYIKRTQAKIAEGNVKYGNIVRKMFK